jgi:hypothetical protein
LADAALEHPEGILKDLVYPICRNRLSGIWQKTAGIVGSGNQAKTPSERIVLKK